MWADNWNEWAADWIAGPMGYKHIVPFPRARDALSAYAHFRNVELPANICSVAYEATGAKLRPVDANTGLVGGLPVQLYGYRQRVNGEIDLDPLMTGWLDRPCCESSIISFGRKKMLDAGGGGAFLTNNDDLAEQIRPCGFWPDGLSDPAQDALDTFHVDLRQRWDRMEWWDRYLGDLLQKPPLEQVMPWRCIRLSDRRDAIVKALRRAGYDAGTNYPSLLLRDPDPWGERVLNLFVTPDYDEARIRNACEIIKGVL